MTHRGPMIVTSTPLTLSYFIRDISEAIATFNRVQWFRSTGQNNLYFAVSDFVAGVATITGGAVTPHEINGKTLSLMVNGAIQVDVVFATADPVSTGDAAVEIAAASALLTAVDDGAGHLQISTVGTGTGSSVEVLESTAALSLGFQVGDSALGTGTDNILVPGTHEYFFTDQNSDVDYWYRVQLRNDVTLQETALTVPFPASAVAAVPVSQTVVAYIRLADLSGKSLVERKVTLHNSFLPNVVSGFGLFRHSLEMATDRNGYAEVRVVRGAEIDVSIDGTGFVRRIAIPLTGDAVNLLDPTLVIEDEFGIQQMNVDFAVRTS